MNYLYGIMLIVIGVLVLARYVFNVKMPIFTAAISIMIILVGFSLLISGLGLESDSNIIFRNKTIQVINPTKKYNLVFSLGTIDLSTIKLQDKGQKIIINSIFAGLTIKVKPGMPAIIKINSAFALAKTPDDAKVYWGKYSYKTANFNEDSNYLEIETKNIFSYLTINEIDEPITKSFIMHQENFTNDRQNLIYNLITRKHYTGIFKDHVILELLEEQKKIAQISSETGIHPTKPKKRKQKAVNNMQNNYIEDHKTVTKSVYDEKTINELYAEIGRLTIKLMESERKRECCSPAR